MMIKLKGERETLRIAPRGQPGLTSPPDGRITINKEKVFIVEHHFQSYGVGRQNGPSLRHVKEQYQERFNNSAPNNTTMLVIIEKFRRLGSILCRLACYNADYKQNSAIRSGEADGQHLDFNDQHFGPNMNTVSKVNISNCDQVTFNTNSFRHLDNLQKLVVSRVRSAIFNPGVFQSLKNLTLVQIQSLDFKQGAFMGVKELEEIEIHNSYIPQLASHSFYDIKDLKLVSLTNVTVNVKRNAIKVEMAKTDSEVIFTDCMIRSVEENGITVKTDTFIIRNSTVGNLAPNSITINSTEAILITQSQFNSTLDSNAIHMTAPNVTIDSNVFDLLSMEILANINSKSNGKVKTSVLELEAWATFALMSTRFLGNQRADNYAELV
ncbi:hypothetical protein ANN_08151 [Periplaneta americana]|uniref:Uncharacterized protein n=1 Tax=Periplaneta americana TaxID=6978 RepID=A0ABQ8T0L3_PERAM|nr:hypothetical protein ANN_08151 [Periplaneta americana]